MLKKCPHFEPVISDLLVNLQLPFIVLETQLLCFQYFSWSNYGTNSMPVK